MNSVDVTESINSAVEVSLNDAIVLPANGFGRVSIWRVVISFCVVLWLGVQLLSGIQANGPTLDLYRIILFYGGLFSISLVEIYVARVSFRLIVGLMPSKSEVMTWLPVLVLSVMVSLCASIMLDSLLAVISPELCREIRSSGPYPTLIGGPVIELIVIVVMIPAFEEFIFRGIILCRLVYLRGHLPAIILSSAIYSVLHLYDPAGAMVAGVMFAYAYLKTGSLVLSVVLHAAYNALVYQLDNLFTIWTWSGDEMITVSGVQTVAAFLIATLSIVVMIWWLKRRGVGGIRGFGQSTVNNESVALPENV